MSDAAVVDQGVTGDQPVATSAEEKAQEVVVPVEDPAGTPEPVEVVAEVVAAVVEDPEKVAAQQKALREAAADQKVVEEILARKDKEMKAALPSALRECTEVVEREEVFLGQLEESIGGYKPAVVPVVTEWIRKIRKNLVIQKKLLGIYQTQAGGTADNLGVLVHRFKREESEMAVEYQVFTDKLKKAKKIA